MKKRLKKKEYKAIQDAKLLMDNWDGDIYAALIYGYLDPDGKKTRLGRAIRKVTNASCFYEVSKGWQFFMPSDVEAFYASPSYNVSIYGKDYFSGCGKAYEDCDSIEIKIDLRALLVNEYYQRGLASHKNATMIFNFIGFLKDAATRY